MELQMQFYDLSVESACCHDDWKVRLLGYQKAFEIFLQIEDKNSQKWNSFLDIVKNFVMDQNPQCLVKGLLAVLIFVKKCGQAARTAKDVVGGIANTCFDTNQSCIFTLAVDIIFCYIKIGQQHIVNRKLTDIIQQSGDEKRAKICLYLIGEGIKQFGITALELKRLISVLASLLNDKSKGVRKEVEKLLKHLTIWATPEILNSINKVLPSEQVTPVEKHNDIVPDNSLESLQNVNVDVANAENASQVNCNAILNLNSEQLLPSEDSDPYTVIEYRDITRTQIFERDIRLSGHDFNKFQIENASFIITQSSISPSDEFHTTTRIKQNTIVPYIQNPFNLLEKFKKKFYVQENSFEKWYELDYYIQNILHKLMEENNCSIWIDSLLMYLANKDFPLDVNCTSVKCVTFCAKALKNDFEPYVQMSMPLLFRKFEVKQRDLTSYVRECIDSIFDCTNLEKLQTTVSSIYTKNWNPSVKIEINMFLIRCFSKSKLYLTKDCMKTYYSCLTMDLDSKYFNIRRSAIEALGTVMRMVDKKSMEPHLGHVKQFMMTKIQKFAESITLPDEEDTHSDTRKDLILNNKNEEDSVSIQDEYDETNEYSLSDSEEEYIDSDPESSSIEDDCCLEYTRLKCNYLEKEEEIQDLTKVDEEVKEDNAISTFYKGDFNYTKEKNEEFNGKNYRETDEIMESKSFWEYDNENMDILLLNYPSWEDYIHPCDTDGCTDIEITEKIKSRIKQDFRLRTTGNDVKDQLLKNLYRKYNVELGKMPTNVQCHQEYYQNKIELLISNGIIRNLRDKDLNLRRLSLERIQFLVNSTPYPIDCKSPSLEQAASIIAERISDCSLEISLTAIFLIESLVTSMGPSSEQYIKTFFPPLLQAVGDPRPGVQVSALFCIKKWEETCGIEKFFLLATLGDANKRNGYSTDGKFIRWLPDVTGSIATAWPTFTANLMKDAWLQCWGTARKMIQSVKTL
ncbi:unnamed protein product [Nezara viridula]|uniref:TOG domain-containing protein n=1 Tax=Nezara viridula TaxID=85310 RepID=A0A9P0HK47_NEZVI|nr:unnamed protein product [Nezara viridula]